MLKIVYILTGTENDFFINQLRISVASLKRRVEDVEIILLTDDVTEIFLKHKKVDNIVTLISKVTIDSSFSAKEKSRYLKTKMRSLVEGDFLYIDTDTVICSDLSMITDIPKTSAVLDNNMEITESIVEFNGVIERAEQFGFSAGYNGKHYNSGVIWCKDDRETYKFFEEWHLAWLETRKSGILIDQLSFNEVNNRKKGFLNEINGTWNCQLRYGIPYLADAKIIHYFASNLSANRKKHFAYKITDKDVLLTEGMVEINGILELIENPRSAFHYAMPVEVETDNYYIINSNIGKAFRYIYRKYNRLFWKINTVLSWFDRKGKG